MFLSLVFIIVRRQCAAVCSAAGETENTKQEEFINCIFYYCRSLINSFFCLFLFTAAAIVKKKAYI